ncbi:hypothetical protein R69658_01973 [Paraburkholderia aspalathi]|uniref:Uncharacterized protein n=1 Tax=Paraburkholderia aspalathi TaxID=1324617 RepID=A0ABM8R5W5_9BURK|nr:hypothetical protein R69658_01973 [Paraburkholderia aspalathi]
MIGYERLSDVISKAVQRAQPTTREHFEAQLAEGNDPWQRSLRTW